MHERNSRVKIILRDSFITLIFRPSKIMKFVYRGNSTFNCGKIRLASWPTITRDGNKIIPPWATSTLLQALGKQLEKEKSFALSWQMRGCQIICPTISTLNSHIIIKVLPWLSKHILSNDDSDDLICNITIITCIVNLDHS